MSLLRVVTPTSWSDGVRYMIAAAFFFSLMSAFVKLAGERLPAMQIVFARALLTLIITWFMLKRVGLDPWGNRKGLLFVRGFIGFVALSCFYYAITLLPLADVTVIQYMNPIFTAVLAAVFLGEMMKRGDIIALFLGAAGLILVAQPGFLFGGMARMLDPMGVAFAVAGAIFSAGAYVTVRKLRETEAALVVVFYFPLVSTPAALPALAFEALWPTPVEWLLLLAVGIFTQLGQVYLTRGLHAEKAGRAMSISYIQIVFATLWGLLFFGEVPDGFTILGAAMIVGAIFLVGGKK